MAFEQWTNQGEGANSFTQDPELSMSSMGPMLGGISTGNPLIDMLVSWMMQGKLAPRPVPGMRQGPFDAYEMMERNIGRFQVTQHALAGHPLAQRFGIKEGSPFSQIGAMFLNQPDNPILKAAAPFLGGNPVKAGMIYSQLMGGQEMGAAFGQMSMATPGQAMLMQDTMNLQRYNQQKITAPMVQQNQELMYDRTAKEGAKARGLTGAAADEWMADYKATVVGTDQKKLDEARGTYEKKHALESTGALGLGATATQAVKAMEGGWFGIGKADEKGREAAFKNVNEATKNLTPEAVEALKAKGVDLSKGPIKDDAQGKAILDKLAEISKHTEDGAVAAKQTATQAKFEASKTDTYRPMGVDMMKTRGFSEEQLAQGFKGAATYGFLQRSPDVQTASRRYMDNVVPLMDTLRGVYGNDMSPHEMLYRARGLAGHEGVSTPQQLSKFKDTLDSFKAHSAVTGIDVNEYLGAMGMFKQVAAARGLTATGYSDPGAAVQNVMTRSMAANATMDQSTIALLGGRDQMAQRAISTEAQMRTDPASMQAAAVYAKVKQAAIDRPQDQQAQSAARFIESAYKDPNRGTFFKDMNKFYQGVSAASGGKYNIRDLQEFSEDNTFAAAQGQMMLGQAGIDAAAPSRQMQISDLRSEMGLTAAMRIQNAGNTEGRAMGVGQAAMDYVTSPDVDLNTFLKSKNMQWIASSTNPEAKKWYEGLQQVHKRKQDGVRVTLAEASNFLPIGDKAMRNKMQYATQSGLEDSIVQEKDPKAKELTDKVAANKRQREEYNKTFATVNASIGTTMAQNVMNAVPESTWKDMFKGVSSDVISKEEQQAIATNASNIHGYSIQSDPTKRAAALKTAAAGLVATGHDKEGFWKDTATVTNLQKLGDAGISLTDIKALGADGGMDTTKAAEMRKVLGIEGTGSAADRKNADKILGGLVKTAETQFNASEYGAKDMQGALAHKLSRDSIVTETAASRKAESLQYGGEIAKLGLAKTAKEAQLSPEARKSKEEARDTATLMGIDVSTVDKGFDVDAFNKRLDEGEKVWKDKQKKAGGKPVYWEDSDMAKPGVAAYREWQKLEGGGGTKDEKALHEKLAGIRSEHKTATEAKKGAGNEVADMNKTLTDLASQVMNFNKGTTAISSELAKLVKAITTLITTLGT